MFSKYYFSFYLPSSRRSVSASTNQWVRSDTNLAQIASTSSGNPGSPPCRDRPQYLINHSKSHSTLPSCSTSSGFHHQPRPLQSPAIISKHYKTYSSASPSSKGASGRLDQKMTLIAILQKYCNFLMLFIQFKFYYFFIMKKKKRTVILIL